MLNYRIRIFLIVLLLIVSQPGFAQFFHRNLNRTDESGRRQGKWVLWQDSARRRPFCTGWYKDGVECRVTRYYNNDGKVRMKLSFRGDSLVIAKYYDSSGRLREKARARQVITPTEYRLCWDGKWKQYDKWHRVIRKSFYRKGQEVLQEPGK